MMRHHLIGTLFVVMGLLVGEFIGSIVTVSAEPIVIDFEDLSSSGPGESGQVEVSTQYENKGITFNSLVALDYSKGLAIPDFAHSGTKAIEQCYAREFCTMPIEMSFTRAQSRVKVRIGYSARIDETRTVILKAFDINGKEVGLAEEILALQGEPLPIRTPLEVTSESVDIIHAVVSFLPDTILMNNLAVDDVEFEAVELPLLLSGRVYEGEVVDESYPLQDATVELYGAKRPYPNSGVLIASTTTDERGWYSLEVPVGYEFYSIRETGPPGYESAGATTVGGTVHTSNWIEYVIPLEEKTLTGNKFWVKGPALPTPTPILSPVVTPRPAPEEGPDLIISSADHWFEDDDRVLVLLVEIANQGNTWAPGTMVYAGDPDYGLPGRTSPVPGLDPDETTTVEVWIEIPEEERGRTHTLLVEVDPEAHITELDEENNIARTPEIFIPPGELEHPDLVPLIIVIAISTTTAAVILKYLIPKKPPQPKINIETRGGIESMYEPDLQQYPINVEVRGGIERL
ncbi:MAG: CARDB domain-containing protein [Halobacteriota archaeon]